MMNQWMEVIIGINGRILYTSDIASKNKKKEDHVTLGGRDSRSCKMMTNQKHKKKKGHQARYGIESSKLRGKTKQKNAANELI
jgi:hypothetical protein